MEAEGKVALVVGASKGVGLAVRRLLISAAQGLATGCSLTKVQIKRVRNRNSPSRRFARS